MGVKYYYENLAVSSETILSTTATIDSLYPLSNLKDPRKSKKVMTSSAESMTIELDLQAPDTVDSFLFLEDPQSGFEFESVLIEGNATDVWTSPAVSETLNLSAQNSKWGFANKEITGESLRFWRMTFTNTLGSGYVATGKVFLGGKFELPGDDMNLGWSMAFKDLSTIQKNKYGQYFSDKRGTQRIISGAYRYVNPDNLELMSDMYLTNGIHTPLWLIMDDTESIVNEKERLAMYCRFTKIPPEKNDYYALYNFDLTFEEVL